jgi:hypothetical protein
MPANAFISYDHDDQLQVAGFKLLKNNPNHPLDFQDHSLKDAVRDRSGKPIKYPPSDARSKPVRDEIKRKFDCASKLVGQFDFWGQYQMSLKDSRAAM